VQTVLNSHCPPLCLTVLVLLRHECRFVLIDLKTDIDLVVFCGKCVCFVLVLNVQFVLRYNVICTVFVMYAELSQKLCNSLLIWLHVCTVCSYCLYLDDI